MIDESIPQTAARHTQTKIAAKAYKPQGGLKDTLSVIRLTSHPLLGTEGSWKFIACR